MLFPVVKHKFLDEKHMFQAEKHKFHVRKHKIFFEEETFVVQKRNFCCSEEHLLMDCKEIIRKNRRWMQYIAYFSVIYINM